MATTLVFAKTLTAFFQQKYVSRVSTSSYHFLLPELSNHYLRLVTGNITSYLCAN